jgi:ADP-ribosyl-[dinitrogen reductase] hydrolase
LRYIEKEIIDRYYGCIVGLAVGDALGAPIEFECPGTFEPIKDMIGGGTHHLEAGEWTDDTSLALCLAESLIETKEFDPIDQLKRYVRWYRDGYMSVNNKCFDIGNTTRKALLTFEETGEHLSSPDDEFSAGNGSLMRLAPIPIIYFSNPIQNIIFSGKSSLTTHNNPLAVDACRFMSSLIHGALIGLPKDEILAQRYYPVSDYWKKEPLEPEISEVAQGSYKNKEPPEIRGRGYVVKSLEAALWAFYKTTSFEEGCLKAVNLGEDADTTGAIYGQLAGAYYGFSNIPQRWTDKLAKIDMLKSITENLWESAINFQD